MTAHSAAGIVIDLILAGMVLEGFYLTALHRAGRFVALRKFLPTLASGMGLLLATQLALSGAWLCAGAALLAAGVAHVFDMLQRGS